MKISELSRRTNVSKQTIHHYIREGVLRKPKKRGPNSADYNESYIEQILIIKNLQEAYFLPLSAIKKILKKLKKKTDLEKSAFQYLGEFLRPLDRLLMTEVVGRRSFMQATGIAENWLQISEEWGIISSYQKNGKTVYSQDDVILAKIMVEMDRLGYGPKNGYNVADLRRVMNFIRDYVKGIHQEYYHLLMRDLSQEELIEKGAKFTEMMCLFFYHAYRKLIREELETLLLKAQGKEQNCSTKAGSDSRNIMPQ